MVISVSQVDWLLMKRFEGERHYIRGRTDWVQSHFQKPAHS